MTFSIPTKVDFSVMKKQTISEMHARLANVLDFVFPPINSYYNVLNNVSIMGF